MSYAIDTHCHLTFMPQKVQKAVIDRAVKSGVKKMITVACNADEIQKCLSLAHQYNFVYATAGIHPTDIGKDMESDLKKVYEYAKNEKKIVAIGEIGLDYYHDRFPHDLQMEYLSRQLAIAKELNKPAIIHCRAGKFAGENSSIFPDMVKALNNANFSNGVMHCFSGTKKEAEAFLEMGLMISFTGIITYERNQELRDIVKVMPIEKLMIETDSPFLPPLKYKGQKNEPAYVFEVAKTIAEIKGLSVYEVLGITTRNAEEFFGI